MNATRSTGQRLIFPETIGYSGRIARTPLPRPPDENDQFDDAETICLLSELLRLVELRPPANPEKWIGRNPASALRCEFRFWEIVQACVSAQLFPWLLVGRWLGEGEQRYFELAARGRSALGRRLARLDSGKTFVLDDGRRVRLSHRGRLRHRRYRIEVL